MEIEGKATAWHTLSLTNDAATTGRINMDGFTGGRIINSSGGELTIAYYDAQTKTSTAIIAANESGTALAQTIADARSEALPAAVKGCTWLTPVLSTGTATVSVKLTSV